VAATDRVLIRRSAERFTTVGDGVRTRHLLSFGDHYDSALTSLGPLIAHNDEVVEPGMGYAPHRHRGVEIVTWVTAGRLIHRDPSGEAVVLVRGSAQLLSAGTGITHEESADAEDAVGQTRFVQMWLRSDDPDAEPRHAAVRFDDDDLRTRLVPIAAGASAAAGPSQPGPLPLRVGGAVCLVGRVAAGSSRLVPAAGFAHVFVVDGDVSLSGSELGDARLAGGDSALLSGVPDVECAALADAEIVVWTWSPDPTAQKPR
jgi:quercetin 2,3-dioxygenase